MWYKTPCSGFVFLAGAYLEAGEMKDFARLPPLVDVDALVERVSAATGGAKTRGDLRLVTLHADCECCT